MKNYGTVQPQRGPALADTVGTHDSRPPVPRLNLNIPTGAGSQERRIETMQDFVGSSKPPVSLRQEDIFPITAKSSDAINDSRLLINEANKFLFINKKEASLKTKIEIKEKSKGELLPPIF